MRKAGIVIMGEVVLGISGASGAAYGVRLAEALQELKVPIRLGPVGIRSFEFKSFGV